MIEPLNDLQAVKVDDLIELGWEVQRSERFMAESAIYVAEHPHLGRLWLTVRPDGSHKFHRKLKGQDP